MASQFLFFEKQKQFPATLHLATPFSVIYYFRSVVTTEETFQCKILKRLTLKFLKRFSEDLYDTIFGIFFKIQFIQINNILIPLMAEMSQGWCDESRHPAPIICWKRKIFKSM